MYQFSAGKLILILLVLIFSVLYILPTPDRFFDPLYGHMPLWMQKKLPQSQFETIQKNSIEVNLKDVQFPKGTDFVDTTETLKLILKNRLDKAGFSLSDGINGDYQFEVDEANERLKVLFLMDKSQNELQRILSQLHLWGSMPEIVRRLVPAERLQLGLDLRGGVYLVLEVNIEESKKDLLEETKISIPNQMKSATPRILCRTVEEKGETLLVKVGIPSRIQNNMDEKQAYLSKAEEILNSIDFFTQPVQIETVGSKIVTYQIGITEAEKYSDQAIDRVLTVLRNRIDAFGVSEPSIRREEGKPRIIIELPGAKDSSKSLDIVKTMGQLEFKVVKSNPANSRPWILPKGNKPKPDELPEGTEVIQHYEDDSWFVVEKLASVSGDRIRNAYPSRGGQTGLDIVVSLELDAEGTRSFAEVTTQHTGELLAIILDNKIQSAPRINEPIPSGNAQISGSFSFDEATYLANILKSGAYPVQVQIAEERTASPTLGQQSIKNGMNAGLIGMGLVLLFMLIYYRGSGLVAIVALAFNMLIVLGGLAGFGATLTLPGIAGLVLTIGMAVDANVLIFERIREELRNGRRVWAAIENGYSRAFWTILDANLTTFAVALVLYNFGTGPIRGFAVTLSIGILASFFTAIVVTKELYGWFIGNRQISKLSI
ncbi:MAG: protein translocase subunit SecD [Candidatus Poribacteria bacterium]|nr:protein translocase subunit SecD [Candidatus Poribacteria bacterium]|tara:strand:- start:1663 stop:3636 length:1974 start_codon:yes stop_codon:yes gene_type:complete